MSEQYLFKISRKKSSGEKQQESIKYILLHLKLMWKLVHDIYYRTMLSPPHRADIKDAVCIHSRGFMWLIIATVMWVNLTPDIQFKSGWGQRLSIALQHSHRGSLYFALFKVRGWLVLGYHCTLTCSKMCLSCMKSSSCWPLWRLWRGQRSAVWC